ncbi:GATA-type zinc finger protein 1 isoform X2 [Castor canadensis]|uniref:GATA-type zinc finger protein 1 n=1 Tax=Castor canadensis TaxID=51338 RepID=A0A8C0WSP5_CASCN|nr:GATA-type zinc finger protein 1 [Castor canadensis]
MEADRTPDLLLLRELLAPPCLDPESSPPGPSAQREPRPLRCVRPGGRSLWPACQDSVSLCFLQETEEGLQSPIPDTQALAPCWESVALGTLDTLTMVRSSKNRQASVSHKCHRLECHQRPPQRRRRKQPKPSKSSEKVDPGFKGVTLRFQIKPDASLQIVPTYSLPGSSHSRGPPASPARAPEPSPRMSEALDPPGPRRCASCRTQRTPLWRDAEDGTPLCNACGIRYKKYGTRCSSCWLVPRKSVQPKRLCGRCGLSLSPHHGPTQEA